MVFVSVGTQKQQFLRIFNMIENSKVLKDDEVTTKIINVMITNLYELEKAYPKNIKIKEENNE